jgi:uncharacterized protein (TIGR02996 family)
MGQTVTLDDLLAIIGDPGRTQRERLAELHDRHVAAIRALYDDDHERVLAEIKKRLKSPKLAGDVDRLVELATRERAPHPRPAGAARAERDEDRAAELEAAITADPESPDAYVVYGDWLQRRGDPRGELIAIGQAMLRSPSDTLRAAHRKHLADHAQALLGPLAAHEHVLADVDWYMGFIRRCRITSRTPLGWTSVDLGQVTRWLLDRPGCGRFLQELVVGIERRNETAYEAVCRAIALRPRPTLRSLRFGDYASENAAGATGDASAIWPAVPNLRAFSGRAARLTLASPEQPMHAPWLERLAVWADREAIAAIAAAELPELRELELGFAWDADVTPDDVEPLLASTGMPKLRALALHGWGQADAACERIVRSPLMATVRELDLGFGGLTFVGAQVLRESRELLASVRIVTEGIDDPVARTILAELAGSDDRDDD